MIARHWSAHGQTPPTADPCGRLGEIGQVARVLAPSRIGFLTKGRAVGR